MKLLSMISERGPTYGALHGEGVVELGSLLGDRYPDLKSLLGAANGLAEAADALQSGQPTLALNTIQFLPVIPNPNKIFCIGVNYADHRDETDSKKADHPTVFMRFAASQTGHNTPLVLPHESDGSFDYEGEVAIVIGRGGRRIAPADAWQHVAGYACYNDASVRDWQFHTTQWGPGKNFVGTGAFGPWLVTADELDVANEPLELITRVNDEVLQQSHTDLMLFKIPELIAYCSILLPLEPGDVIVTGTPGGVGMAREPKKYLKPGDIVEVEVSGVGVLRNRVEKG